MQFRRAVDERSQFVAEHFRLAELIPPQIAQQVDSSLLGIVVDDQWCNELKGILGGQLQCGRLGG